MTRREALGIWVVMILGALLPGRIPGRFPRGKLGPVDSAPSAPAGAKSRPRWVSVTKESDYYFWKTIDGGVHCHYGTADGAAEIFHG